MRALSGVFWSQKLRFRLSCGDRSLSGANTLYVDDQPSVQFQASAFDSLLEARQIASNGMLTLLTVKDGGLLRYRVTPPSDTSLATLVRDPSAGR